MDKEKDIIQPLKKVLSIAYTEFLNSKTLDKPCPVKWIDIKILVSAINMLSDDNEQLITDDKTLELKSTIDI